MIHSRHFIPGTSTVFSLLGALTAADVAAWGGALTAFVCTFAGIVHDVLKKRDQRRHDRARAARQEQWDKWAMKRRMKVMDGGGTDPFPDGLPPLEADDDEDEGEAK